MVLKCDDGRMRVKTWFVLFGLLVAMFAVGARGAEATALTVNCAAGETVASALEKQEPGMPLVLTITGTCRENVTIARDDVTLQGGSDSAVVQAADDARGAIVIDGAQRVVIERLTVRRGTHGVAALHGATAILRDNIIRFTGREAVLIDGGSHAVIQRNVIETKSARQIQVSSSTADLSHNTLRGGPGVALTSGGVAQLGPALVLTASGAVDCQYLQADMVAQIKSRTDRLMTETTPQAIARRPAGERMTIAMNQNCAEDSK
jgi:Right handed beta helix region